MPVPGDVRAGKVSKPYGLQGQLNVIIDPVTGKHIKVEVPLFIDIDGQRVPFFVEDVELISSDQALVKLEFINSIEEARKYTGCEVYVETIQKHSSHHSKSDFFAVIGFKAYDLNLGFLGMVTDFVQNEMNPVFVIDHHGKELLVPSAEELISKIEQKEQSVYFQLPEGLTNL